MTLSDVEEILAERLGFDVHTIGAKAVETGILESMKEAGISDPADYARILAEGSEPWENLVDRVVIPETWFFRDIAPFELAANLARAHVLREPTKVFRVLSCPCSTGEEPYSLAMTMHEAGIPPTSFAVEALDVRRGALKAARAALFSDRSFRDNIAWRREPYFEPFEIRGLWRLRDSVASSVRFQYGNLVASNFLTDAEPFHLVFCRNLLIYLLPDARLRAMAALRRVLAQDGVLVMGHAEAAFAREQGFKATGPLAAFAFTKGERELPLKLPVASRPKAPASSSRPTEPAVFAMSATVDVTVDLAPATTTSSRNSEVTSLAEARHLGDAGKLEEAFHVCAEYLERVPDSADGHFLLGVLYDSMGHLDLAMKSFRKSLYLDPAHRDALLHLALKHEARGDRHGAALLRERARRSPDESVTE